jgi:hypothetical protein
MTHKSVSLPLLFYIGGEPQKILNPSGHSKRLRDNITLAVVLTSSSEEKDIKQSGSPRLMR